MSLTSERMRSQEEVKVGKRTEKLGVKKLIRKMESRMGSPFCLLMKSTQNPSLAPSVLCLGDTLHPPIHDSLLLLFFLQNMSSGCEGKDGRNEGRRKVHTCGT